MKWAFSCLFIIGLLLVSCAPMLHEHTYSDEWTYDDLYHWHAATCEHTSEVSGKGFHVWSEWSVFKEAVNDDHGISKRFCSICGAEESETIHNWDVGTVISEATCTESGIIEYKCKVCEETKRETIPAKGHSFSEDYSYDAQYHWHAATCGHTTEISGKEKHIWEGDTCTICGYQCNHSYSSGKCIYCGSIDYDTVLSVDGNGYISINEDYKNILPEVIIIPTVVNGTKVKGISSYAFSGCMRIHSIVIPDGITTIGNDAFSGCSGLETITLGKDIQTIASKCLAGLNKLSNIVVSENNEYFYTIDGVLYSGTILVQYPRCKTDNVFSIPEGIETVGEQAFYNCYNLETINCPSTLKEINKEAFKSCNSLKTVNLNEGLVSIGAYVFSGIPVTEITLPSTISSTGYLALASIKKAIIADGATTIPNGAFSSAYSLTTVVIPDSVKTIGSQAFKDCSSLTSVTLPDSVEYIGDQAFYNCEKLSYVNIPEKVTSLLYQTFWGCTSIMELTIPSSVKSLGKYVFAGWKDYQTMICNTSFPDGNGKVGFDSWGSFKAKLIVNIPEGETVVGANAFVDCTGLTSITLPDSIERIEDNAFYGTNLKTINIPKNVTYIGVESFRGNSGMTYTVDEDNTVYASQNGVLFSKDMTTLLSKKNNDGDQYVMPDSVSVLNICCFEDCNNINILINNPVKINYGAFTYCSGKITFVSSELPSPEKESIWGSKIDVFVPQEYTDAYTSCFSNTPCAIINSY